jgi:hypothetical protein
MFAQSSWVRLIKLPDRVYQVTEISDTSHLDPNHRAYEPPYFYKLRRSDGAIVHWPHSCLEPAEAPIAPSIAEIDHSPESADYWDEWRKWPDGQWTNTGTVGIRAMLISRPERISRRPNSRLFAHGFDPNTDPTLEPESTTVKQPPKLIEPRESADLKLQRDRVSYAESTIQALRQVPNSEAAIAAVQAILDDANQRIMLAM